MQSLDGQWAERWGISSTQLTGLLGWSRRHGLGLMADEAADGGDDAMGRLDVNLLAMPEDGRLGAWVQLFGILGMRLPHREILGAITAATPTLRGLNMMFFEGTAPRVGLSMEDVSPSLLCEMARWARLPVPTPLPTALWLTYGPGGVGMEDGALGLHLRVKRTG